MESDSDRYLKTDFENPILVNNRFTRSKPRKTNPGSVSNILFLAVRLRGSIAFLNTSKFAESPATLHLIANENRLRSRNFLSLGFVFSASENFEKLSFLVMYCFFFERLSLSCV